LKGITQQDNFRQLPDSWQCKNKYVCCCRAPAAADSSKTTSFIIHHILLQCCDRSYY